MSNETTYEPGVGIHIDDACKEAVAMAQRLKTPIDFSFNEIELVAFPDSDAIGLSQGYSAAREKRVQAYRESPEGKKAAQERAAEIARKQDLHDSLVRGLKTAINTGMDSVIAWLRPFQEASDYRGVKSDFVAVIATFEAAGYEANENTGLPRAHYSSRPIMGRYIIGQAIACMKNGMPPHQITHTFAEKYFSLNS